MIVWCRSCETEPLDDSVIRLQPSPFPMCDSCCLKEYSAYPQRYVLGPDDHIIRSEN
jgi:hypothetical protein